jgi:hypothetical protein
VKVFLRVFQLIGIYPISSLNSDESLNDLDQHKWINGFWSLAHFLAVSAELTVLLSHKELLFYGTTLGILNDILLFSATLTAHLVIIAESYFQRKQFIKFWRHFFQLLRTSQLNQLGNFAWMWRILIKFSIYLIFTLVVEISVITNIGDDEQWTKYWFSNILSLMVTRIRHLQQILFVDILYYSVLDFNTKLENTVQWAILIGEDKNFTKNFIQRNLRIKKEQFRLLMMMLIRINRIFGWSQLFNLGQNLIEITAELYWLYRAIFNNFQWRKLEAYFKLILI